MELRVIGSSSNGNSYVITNGSETLIIEAGMRFHEVKKAINFNVGSINALLVSHSHSDHAAYVGEYCREGVEVIAPPGVATSIIFSNLLDAKAGKSLQAGRFNILPFNVVHDVPCFGYLINHPETGKIVFITDTHYSPVRFKDVNHYIIEANYSNEILDYRLHHCKISYAYYERVLRSHMSLETAIKLLKANDLTHTRTITLIHLSDGNSDERLFQNTVAKETGVPTYVADSGRSFNLSII